MKFNELDKIIEIASEGNTPYVDVVLAEDDTLDVAIFVDYDLVGNIRGLELEKLDNSTKIEKAPKGSEILEAIYTFLGTPLEDRF